MTSGLCLRWICFWGSYPPQSPVSVGDWGTVRLCCFAPVGRAEGDAGLAGTGVVAPLYLCLPGVAALWPILVTFAWALVGLRCWPMLLGCSNLPGPFDVMWRVCGA